MVLVGVAAFNYWQQQQIRQAMPERTDVRDAADKAAPLQNESQHLTAQPKVDVESSQVDRREFMRSRQLLRRRQSEQENAQNKVVQQSSTAEVPKADQEVVSAKKQQSAPPSSTNLTTLPAGATDRSEVETQRRPVSEDELVERFLTAATAKDEDSVRSLFWWDSPANLEKINSNISHLLSGRVALKVKLSVNDSEIISRYGKIGLYSTNIQAIGEFQVLSDSYIPHFYYGKKVDVFYLGCF